MRRPIAVLAFLVAAPGWAGCSSQQGASADASSEFIGVQMGPDAGGGDAASDSESPLSTTVRLANMSPDLGSIDFCWRVAGAQTFTGPVLGASPDAGMSSAGDAGDAGDAREEPPPDAGAGDTMSAVDGATDAAADAANDGERDAEPDAETVPDATVDVGVTADAGSDADASNPQEAGAPLQVSFGAMSPPIQLPAIGTLDIALVQANQLSCSAPKFVGRVTVDAGKTSTLAVMGQGEAEAGTASALSLVAFTDELPDPAIAKVRFIHAALGWQGSPPAPPLSVRSGSVVLAPEINPRMVTGTAPTPPVDSLGYATVPPIVGSSALELDSLGDAAPHTWTTAPAPLAIDIGTTRTGFAVSFPSGGLGVAWCSDGESGGVVVPCQLLPAP
jgi:hypothetical protein